MPVYKYTEIMSDFQSFVETDFDESVDVYSNVELDTKKGRYVGIGSPVTKTFRELSEDIFQNIFWWTLNREADFEETPIWYYDSFLRYTMISEDYMYADRLVLEREISGYEKGTYVETVVAEEGAYPNNAKHSDGYWYVKSTEFNEPPSAPVVISPNGGEIITAPFLIEWETSTDINGNSLTYQIELTTDNGKNWSQIANGTTKKQFTYNFVDQPDTSTAKIRVRAYDGELFGDWGVSDNVFTINYNYPPNPPYNLVPINGEVADSEKTIRFSWTHSDPNDSDPQSKFDLRWRIVGGTWNEISEITTRTYQDIPANTFPLGQIEWQVRTYDQAGLVSEWSSIIVFTSGSKPETALWVYPTHGQKVTDAKPTFQWSSNIQTACRIILYDENDFIMWDTGEIEGITKAISSGITLEDGGVYSVSVLIRNKENFWSEEEKIVFSTSYSPPPKPMMNLDGSEAAIVVEINNPTSEGLQPQTVSNEIYKIIDGEWVRISVGIPPNGVFVDYTARSNKKEQYRVKAVGDNEGIQYSDTYTTTISFHGVYLHDTQDPKMTVKQFKFDGGGRASNWSKEYTLMNFKGRKRPVVEFSENESSSVSVTLQLLHSDDYFDLENLAKGYNTLCYRDGRGRLLFGFIPSLPASDEIYGHEVSFEFIGIDYKGSV